MWSVGAMLSCCQPGRKWKQGWWLSYKLSVMVGGKVGRERTSEGCCTGMYASVVEVVVHGRVSDAVGKGARIGG